MEELGGGFVLVLGEEIVSTVDGRHNFSARSQSLLQRSTGPQRSLLARRFEARLLLASETGEELVEIMNHAQRSSHVRTSKRRAKGARSRHVISQQREAGLATDSGDSTGHDAHHSRRSLVR